MRLASIIDAQRQDPPTLLFHLTRDLDLHAPRLCPQLEAASAQTLVASVHIATPQQSWPAQFNFSSHIIATLAILIICPVMARRRRLPAAEAADASSTNPQPPVPSSIIPSGVPGVMLTASGPAVQAAATQTVTTQTAQTAQTAQNGNIVMIGRHAVRRGIRGPQSALTDFLASHNISANQIRLDADQRRQQALASAQLNGDDAGEGPSTANGANGDGDEDGDGEVKLKNDGTKRKAAKRKLNQQKAIDKIKASKKFKTQKSLANSSDDDDDLIQALLADSMPQPGQMANCQFPASTVLMPAPSVFCC